jgi:hypothetical protein
MGKEVFGTEDVAQGKCNCTWQGRPHLPGWLHLQGRPCLVVRPCLARVARWFLFHLNVYLSKKIAKQLVELY